MPATTESVRRHNAALVLSSLRLRGPATRAQLAERTGLAKATVGVIVADLDAGGALSEEETRAGARGRPGRPVRLAGSVHLSLGLEINVDYVAAVVLDLTGAVVHTSTLPVTGDASSAQTLVVRLAQEVTERFPADRHVLVGAHVAVPGLVRRTEREVLWAPNLALHGTRRLGSDLLDAVGEALTGRVPVQISNDANCAALAEAFHGQARDVPDALYLTGTVGIGAGILHEGRLFGGADGFAGEVGHMPVGDLDAQCGCGLRGCWEASVGLHAMLAAVGLPEVGTPVRSAEQVARRAPDEPSVREGLELVGRHLGAGLATLTQVLDPERIVLGGYFVPLGEWLLEPARDVLAERLAPSGRRPPDVGLSGLGILAAATGAAELSLREVFTGTTPLPRFVRDSGAGHPGRRADESG